jgi:hypothetical protein
MKIKLFAALAAVMLVIAAGAGYIWQRNGAYGFDVVARRGGTLWIDVRADDPRLSPAMRLALQPVIPAVTAGPISWREVEPGFEVAELPVLAGNREVDRLLLNRVDPKRFHIVARNYPSGRDVDQWEKALPRAVLIVNGSYFGLKGEADTPFISQGTPLGPKTYDAKAGAIVASADGAQVVDLRQQDWRAALNGASNAMVSYPLLIGDDGKTHVPVKSNWLANRTFVAEDGQGRIIIGSTKEAFFSLGRLAEFLKAAPLDIKAALNLDGGPIACQSVRLSGYGRNHYARWEAQVVDGQVRLLTWPVNRHWAMPVVLTVERP